MAVTYNEAFRNLIASTSGFHDVLNAGLLKLYGGDVPANADAALGGATLLVTISDDDLGTGCSWDSTASVGVITKDTAATWEGTIGTTGVSTFFRYEGASSAVAQGLVGVAGADLNLSDTSLTATQNLTINYFALAVPAQGG